MSLQGAVEAIDLALDPRQPVRIYGCCAQPEGELHTTECPNMRHLAARQPVGEPVAYLDLGAGGYMDVGTDLSKEELAALPKGRHMLGIIGTYGVDGYKPAQAVDLGPVRDALDAAEGFSVVCASVDGYSREEVATSGRAMRQQFADARALIDSQAVGNG
ncbi:TPA: hypothetical protein RNS88_003642 [Stenotrophomonas maltophilia]|nr:hypothetical protein [Stenotrophomonas maltophilia]